MKVKRVILGPIWLLLMVLPFAANVPTQVGFTDGARVSIYHWPDYVPQPPLEIVKMKVADQEVISGREFSSTSDWLKNFTVTLRNVSQKNVKYLRVRIEFPRDTKGNSILNDILFPGGQMFYFSPEIARTGEDLTLAPSRTVDLRLHAWAFAIHQHEIASKGVSNKVANFAIISVDLVLFDDDTGWISGNKAVRDKNNPSRWVRDKSADAPSIPRP